MCAASRFRVDVSGLVAALAVNDSRLCWLCGSQAIDSPVAGSMPSNYRRSTPVARRAGCELEVEERRSATGYRLLGRGLQRPASLSDLQPNHACASRVLDCVPRRRAWRNVIVGASRLD